MRSSSAEKTLNARREQAGIGRRDPYPVRLDVADAASISAAETLVRDALGPACLQGLVNDAGMTITGPLEFVELDADAMFGRMVGL